MKLGIIQTRSSSAHRLGIVIRGDLQISILVCAVRSTVLKIPLDHALNLRQSEELVVVESTYRPVLRFFSGFPKVSDRTSLINACQAFPMSAAARPPANDSSG